jgi:hypothetical protein
MQRSWREEGPSEAGVERRVWSRLQRQQALATQRLQEAARKEQGVRDSSASTEGLV